MRPDEQLRATDVTSVIKAILMMGPSDEESRRSIGWPPAGKRPEFLSTLGFLL
jgi:hypothetical protein